MTRSLIRPAVAALLLAAAPAALFAAEPQRPSTGEAPLYSEVDRESRYVAVRDGTRLSMSIYRPARDGKAVATRHPVVFVFTPYRTRYRDQAGKIVETGLSEQLGLKGLTDHGYVVAVADIRGKGASFGHRRGFQDRTEALDGYDLVQWLSRQPWSTGKVGMTGCSYVGGTTLQVATTVPPALKAIFTGAADLDKYMFVRRGGITAQFNTRPDEPLAVDLATLPVDEDRDGSMLRKAVAEHAKNTPMAPLWYDMPYRDSMSKLTGTRFWEEVGPSTYLDKLKASGIATYFWGNWQDEPTEQMITAAANLNGKLLVGPGLHCVPPPGFDFSGELRRFFDWQLKGISNGMDKAPRAIWWTDAAAPGKEWSTSDRLPGAGAVRTPLYLGPDALAAAAPTAGSVSFVVNYDVGDPEAFAFWPNAAPPKSLSFTSQPVAADRLLLGGPLAELTVSLDRPDANVFVYLEDVAPDGSSAVISQGRLAVSHRKTGKAPYDTLGMPWHPSRAADVAPLPVGQKAVLAIPMLPTSRVIRQGHRLRLSVAGADPRQRNLQQIKQSPPPRITIWYGGATSTRIGIPWASGTATAAR